MCSRYSIIARIREISNISTLASRPQYATSGAEVLHLTLQSYLFNRCNFLYIIFIWVRMMEPNHQNSIIRLPPPIKGQLTAKWYICFWHFEVWLNVAENIQEYVLCMFYPFWLHLPCYYSIIRVVCLSLHYYSVDFWG